jgi:hypothetical protein
VSQLSLDLIDMPPSLGFASSKVITVLVGKSKASYTLHKDLLCTHSPFFENCLRSNFLEKQRDQVELPEDSPEVFEHFVNWIYREDVIKPTGQTSLELAIHTYVFADKLCMPAFKNRLMSSIRAYHESTAVHLDTMLLWCTLDVPDTLPLGHFLRDQIGFDMIRHPRKYFLRCNGNAKRGDVDSVAEDHGPLVSDLLWAALQAAHQKYDDPALRKGCHYHEHKAGDTECPDAVVPMPKKKEKRSSATTNPSRDDIGAFLRGFGLV